MSALSKSFGFLLACLIALGLGAQCWILNELRYDLPVFMRGGFKSVLTGLLLIFSPFLLAFVGSLLAVWLRRRGSGWAWFAVALPLTLLVLGAGLAIYLTFFPISFSHH